MTDLTLRLAGDIADQFRRRPPADAGSSVACNIRTFRDRRVRRALLAAVDGDTNASADPHPLVRDVAALLRSGD